MSEKPKKKYIRHGQIRTCPSCGEKYIVPKRDPPARTCGNAYCAQNWRTNLRYKNKKANAAHLRSKARHILNHPERYSPTRQQWAERTLDENPE